MSRVMEVQGRLRENTALIAQLEKSLVVHQSKATASSLRSLYKLRHVYEEQFREAASVDSVDIINYRLFEGGGRYSVALVGKAMDCFQNLYSILYSVASTGKPKDTAHLGSEVVTDTTLDFAYANSGSVDLVFTMPNERLLLGETGFDAAMDHFFAMAKSTDVEQIKTFGRTLGLATVRALYKWAYVLSGSAVGADVRWRKDEAIKGSLLLQPAEIAALRALIDMTSDIEVDEDSLVGVLRGFDSTNNTFRFEPGDGGTMMHGKVSDSASIILPVSVPESYIAVIKTTTRVRYATDQPEIHRELLKLEPIAKTD